MFWGCVGDLGRHAETIIIIKRLAAMTINNNNNP